MSGEAKVLTGLLQRRALEQAFAELSHLTDPSAVQQQAQTIAGYGSAALQHLLTLLDTPDPQLRGGLGQVARQLPPDQVVPALRAVVRDATRNDQARLAAVTLLERFLGETVDNAMIGNLGNPSVAARQSLLELIAAMDGEPLSVVEYLEQLAEQPAEVVDMVLDALPEVAPSPHLATFLRMLAQGPDARLARRAVDELIKLRTPAAVRALAGLAPNLPPALAPVANRGLRKLRFSGVHDANDHDPRAEPWYAPGLRWRALMSPVDPAGSQFLWFVGSEETGGRAVFFTVLIHDPYGLRDASGSLEAASDHAPPKRNAGTLHFIVGDGAAPGVTLLEAPFALACHEIRQALTLNWAGGESAPIGYRLFAPLIWLAEEAREVEETPFETPAPDLALAEHDLVAALDLPAFHAWFAGLEDTALTHALGASYARRFRAMSRWLAGAGDGDAARIAATAAHHFELRTSEAAAIVAAARKAWSVEHAHSQVSSRKKRVKENRNA
jgi:hypothetical protein